MRLKNKVCVITGSSRGLGAAIAKGFAKEGALVVITYCEHEKEALLVAKECDSKICMHLDVRDRFTIRKVFKAVYNSHGRIDVLINNAGINRSADFDTQTEEDWNYVLNVNLSGPFRCCQEVLPYISNNGRIINIGSLSGEYGGPRTPSYACTKMGLMALTHNLARFLGPHNICVNTLSPGVISSELTNNTMSSDVRKTVDSLLLIKRLGRFDDIVGAAVFLASDESSYVTAQTISVNGGAWVRN